MELLDALRNQRLDSSIPGLFDVFYDILNNVQIQSNFYITHPKYKPLELPDEVVPLFTKQLLPGLALSEEPDYKFTPKEDFGMNRCQIVANALLEAWLQGHDSPEGRMNFILHNFSLLGIDLKRPYLNANSKDIY
ncbi:hypothetical protein BJP37_15700 [Moorena bouillonii PNG]|uniref:Uncharacterized protein n=1 Tax=Moorena bouillonii PNG TaxID=568701 RepID=A0A1U7N2V9_9CYAN|nr:T3SS effector HopA1 family protein [Moorena bouillonii]OLT60254.1 hypothetical protein BJP37_15700 [Moorena bouillonii PNG]